MEAAGGFNSLPRELRWNIRGYIAERKSFSMLMNPQGDSLIKQLSRDGTRRLQESV